MAVPVLTPKSQTSAIILPPTGTFSNVPANLPIGVYANNNDFISGAVDQVAYTYKMIGGDVLDIEVTEGQIYAAYEDAVLTYSYFVNLHQAKSSVGMLLGSPTGTFNSDGEIKSGSALFNLVNASGSLSLAYPMYDITAVRDVADAFSHEAGIGGKIDIYKASFNTVAEKQDYDLQEIVSASASDPTSNLYGKIVPGSRITVRKVFYKSARAMWRFYGYYGGLNAVGNLSTYGQYADDSTFEVIPAWHNKLQAMAYEDNIYTRISHYSYEIKNNKICLYPIPDTTDINIFWFEFSVGAGSGANVGIGNLSGSSYSASSGKDSRIGGVNNINTLPFSNIPFENINAIGKHWIRRYALAVAKGMLAEVRSKFQTIPIPGESVTLNGADLRSQSKEEKDSLKEELVKILEETDYNTLAEKRTAMSDNTNKLLSAVPNVIFVG
jgi:hypothetical protein